MTLVKSAVLSLHQEHGLTYMLSVRDSRSQWAEQGFQQPHMDLKHFSIFQVFGNVHPGRASLWFSAVPPSPSEVSSLFSFPLWDSCRGMCSWNEAHESHVFSASFSCCSPGAVGWLAFHIIICERPSPALLLSPHCDARWLFSVLLRAPCSWCCRVSFLWGY